MDVIAILHKLESMNLVRLNKQVGNYYSVYCPFHNDGNERRPSCGVLLTTEVRNGNTYPEGWWHCFACGTAKSMQDAITFILNQKGLGNKSGLEWLKENIPGFEETNFDFLIPEDTYKKVSNAFAVSYIKQKISQKPEYISEEELKNYRFTVQYMYDRKLTDAIISKFDVGVDLKYVPEGRKRPVPCITFPVRDEKGNVLFIYRRAIENKNFYVPRDIEKPVYGLYELPKGCERVIICESIINALTCYVYGYPAVALLGTGTPHQLNKLKTLGVSEFILGLDSDDAGDKGCSRIKKALKSVAVIRRMNDIPRGKDINDLSKDEFEEILADRY